jgi:hypothetical protein
MCIVASSQEARFTGDPSLKTLGGVTLWEAFEPVRSRLGKPLRIIEDPGAAFGRQYIYDGLALWAGYGVTREITVQQIEVTSPKLCTRSGVCPGTSAREAQRKLGKPILSEALEEGKNSYSIGIEACWLEVLVSAQTVKSMAVRCQP